MAVIVVAAVAWLMLGPPMVVHGAEAPSATLRAGLPPVPRPEAVQVPKPAPVDNSFGARVQRVQECMERERVDIRPKVVGWDTQGDVARPKLALEPIDLAGEGGP